MKSRTPLLALGALQLALGITLVAYQFWHPIHVLYDLWDRAAILISNDIFDPVRFDAYLKAHGQRPTGLTADLVRAAPSSRPGGYEVIADWLKVDDGSWPIASGLAAAFAVTGGLLMILSWTLKSQEPISIPKIAP